MFRLLFLLSFLITLSSCDQALLGDAEDNTIVNNFEVLWQDYADHYANFRVKQIDWDESYARYRTRLNEQSTEADLYEVLVDMLGDLNDAHVSLFPLGSPFPSFTSGFAARLELSGEYIFNPKLVASRYLVQTFDNYDEDELIHGLLPDNIGYLYIGTMYESLSFWKERMDRIIADLRDTDGLIIDLRNNGGGEDEAGRLLASYFTSAEPLYQQTRYKIGPGMDEFEDLRQWRVTATDAEQYLKPIVLLTDRYTISAGETFSLALRTLPQLTHVGDTTTSAFSDVVERELPNRWGYRVSVSEVFDQNGVSWEGIGLPPSEVIRNTPEEVRNGEDKMLEAALRYF